MAESLFDIFRDNTRAVKNVTRQPLGGICDENISQSKMVANGPIKPNEPTNKTLKTGAIKKSFLSNTGKTVQSTPKRAAFTPRAVNVASITYESNGDKGFNFEDIEFTKPTYKYDNYHTDVFDYLPLPELEMIDLSPPNTPPPATRRLSMELECSYQDEFFKDDFYESFNYDSDLNLPDIF